MPSISLRLLRRWSVVLLPLLGGRLAADAPDSSEVREVTASSSELDQALKGKLTYNFVVVTANDIVDGEGRHFAPTDVRGYVERAKPKKTAAYVFWVPNKESVDIAKFVIGEFSNYGATVFAVREIKKTAEASDQGAKDSKHPKTLMMVGQPNPKALSATDPMPDLSARPAHLRPGPLPPRVRYRFATDAEVSGAAEAATQLLLAPSPPAIEPAADTTLLVSPGAWSRLSKLSQLKSAKSLTMRIELGRKVLPLEGKFLQNGRETAAAIDEIRRLLNSDGGGTLRALNPQEMDFWWTYIAWDIEEPVFLIASKGGKYRFVVHWSHNRLSFVDELNALPTR